MSSLFWMSFTKKSKRIKWYQTFLALKQFNSPKWYPSIDNDRVWQVKRVKFDIKNCISS